jgi:hypothetical protein
MYRRRCGATQLSRRIGHTPGGAWVCSGPNARGPTPGPCGTPVTRGQGHSWPKNCHIHSECNQDLMPMGRKPIPADQLASSNSPKYNPDGKPCCQGLSMSVTARSMPALSGQPTTATPAAWYVCSSRLMHPARFHFGVSGVSPIRLVVPTQTPTIQHMAPSAGANTRGPLPPQLLVAWSRTADSLLCHLPRSVRQNTAMIHAPEQPLLIHGRVHAGFLTTAAGTPLTHSCIMQIPNCHWHGADCLVPIAHNHTAVRVSLDQIAPQLTSCRQRIAANARVIADAQHPTLL